MNMRQNDLCCGHGGVVWRKAAEAEGVEYIVWEWDRLHPLEKECMPPRWSTPAGGTGWRRDSAVLGRIGQACGAGDRPHFD